MPMDYFPGFIVGDFEFETYPPGSLIRPLVLWRMSSTSTYATFAQSGYGAASSGLNLHSTHNKNPLLVTRSGPR
jgi:hypothetical protein